jgi:hypothetical protein
MTIKAELMSKDVLIDTIKAYGCNLMTGLPLKSMTKEAIIVHLEHCNCPKLKELKKEAKI